MQLPALPDRPRPDRADPPVPAACVDDGCDDGDDDDDDDEDDSDTLEEKKKVVKPQQQQQQQQMLMQQNVVQQHVQQDYQHHVQMQHQMPQQFLQQQQQQQQQPPQYVMLSGHVQQLQQSGVDDKNRRVSNISTVSNMSSDSQFSDTSGISEDRKLSASGMPIQHIQQIQTAQQDVSSAIFSPQVDPAQQSTAMQHNVLHASGNTSVPVQTMMGVEVAPKMTIKTKEMSSTLPDLAQNLANILSNPKTKSVTPHCMPTHDPCPNPSATSNLLEHKPVLHSEQYFQPIQPEVTQMQMQSHLQQGMQQNLQGQQQMQQNVQVQQNIQQTLQGQQNVQHVHQMQVTQQQFQQNQQALLQQTIQSNVQQQIDNSQQQMMQQNLQNQSHGLLPQVSIQNQWGVPQYGMSTGQNVVQQSTSMQHIQTQPQHVNPVQQQQTVQEQQVEYSVSADQYHLQTKVVEQHQQLITTLETDSNPECSNLSRRTSYDCQLLSSENENSSHDVTPEQTLIESVDPALFTQHHVPQQQHQHRKLSQQNSLDKMSDTSSGGGASGSGGPQTIADLQQKLVQLTNQPSESLNVGTPPVSHPATPHSQIVGGYDAYMHSLQQKLVNISMPVAGTQSLGPLSPQTTMHSSSAGLIEPSVETVIEGVIMGQEQSMSQFASSQINSECTTDSPVPGGVAGSDMMSPSKENIKTRLQRPGSRLQELEQELAKIHHRGPMLSSSSPQPLTSPVPAIHPIQAQPQLHQPQTLLATVHPTVTVPVAAVSPSVMTTTSGTNTPVQLELQDNVTEQITLEQPVRKISRFMVSKVAGPPVGDVALLNQQQSSDQFKYQQQQLQQQEVARKTGQFSVSTHQIDEPQLMGTPMFVLHNREGALLSTLSATSVGTLITESDREERLLTLTPSEEYQLLIKRQTMELETLQRRHREELERFQQHQLQLLIQQQQQASALHQPLLYHTVATAGAGQTRSSGVDDYMFSTAPQTPLQRISSQSPDTDETLRLATQKLKQPLHQAQPQQQQQTTSIPHAYVIPIPLMPSENVQSIAAQHCSSYSSEISETIGSTNGPTILNPTQYQFAPILPDGANITAATTGTLVAPTPISGSSGNGAAYLHYHQGPTLANFQTFGYTPHGGFFLPTGYRLIYAPTGTPQSQPATPATPQLGHSHDGTPPGEMQHCSEHATTTACQSDQ